jgi:NAD(P)-dependent dehydrogenase (short-subunit alcohol dehydrogenase family)
MKGKIALVTGANGGLGTYVTQALLEAGATVIGLSRKIQQSEFNSQNFTALSAGISTADEAKTAVDSVVSRFGRLDVLVHTVGGFAGGQSIAETDDATFQRMFDVVHHVLYFACGDPGHAQDGEWTDRRHRQSRCIGPRRRRRRIQRLQGSHGFAYQDGSAGK